VHQWAVHTVGGVISASGPLMLIVPENDALHRRGQGGAAGHRSTASWSESRLALFDVQSAHHAGARRDGEPRIGRHDQDVKTATVYYLVRVSMSADEIAKLGNVKRVPGMPVEVFIQTDQRTVLSYFVKPLRDQIAKGVP
jgi:HlyD family secretion protein